MSDVITPFEELNIIDDFLANALAGDEKVGADFVRVLVQGLLQTELGDNIRINVQRAIIGNTPEQRGIRLVIEVLDYEENGEAQSPKIIYDIEPNKRKEIDIVKHNRFYQAKIDSRNLASGEKDFIKLPNLYVITITNYDPFGHDYVSIVKISPEARMEYMMWEEKIFYEKLEAKEAGRVQGHAEGHAEGCSALRDTLKAILCEKGSVTECLEKRIISENDFEVLSRWIRIAAKVESVEQFMSDME